MAVGRDFERAMGWPSPELRDSTAPYKNNGGRLLDEALKREGLTRYRGERLVGAADGSFGRYIAGIRSPSRQVAARIQERFGVLVDAWDVPIPAESGTGEAEPPPKNGTEHD